MRRCADCLLDATHGLYFWPRIAQWQITRRRPAHRIWCRWHAAVQARLRNAAAEQEKESPDASA